MCSFVKCSEWERWLQCVVLQLVIVQLLLSNAIQTFGQDSEVVDNLPEPLRSVYLERMAPNWHPKESVWSDRAMEIRTQPFRGCHHRSLFQFSVGGVKLAWAEARHLLKAELRLLDSTPVQAVRVGGGGGGGVPHLTEYLVTMSCRHIGRVFTEQVTAAPPSLVLDITQPFRQVMDRIARHQQRHRTDDRLNGAGNAQRCDIAVHAISGDTAVAPQPRLLKCNATQYNSSSSPLLLVYYDDIIETSEAASSPSSAADLEVDSIPDVHSREKRTAASTNVDWASKLQEPCQLVRYITPTQQLMTDMKVLSPPALELNACVGRCHYITNDISQTTHSHIQGVLHYYGLNENAPSEQLIPDACCVPIQLSSVSIVSTNANHAFILRTYPQTLTERCGCR
eukprot:scpid52533/ scgid3399/ Bone morphogenetic protein 2